MAKKLLENMSAEKEANDVGSRYMNSSDVLGDMRRDYGSALDGVKVHDDSIANAKVTEAGVDGLASGKDVYMKAGSLSSHAPEVNGLLAHEITHTMQQSGGEMHESAAYGSEQGGLFDWFKRKFGKKSPDIGTASQTALAGVKTDNAGSVDKANLQRMVDMKDRLVGASNTSYRQAVESHQTPAYQVSSGLQGLELRNLGTAAGKIAVDEQNRVFDSVDAYRDYMVGMDQQGVDWSKMDEGMQRGINYGDKQTHINAASAQVTGGLFDIVGKYATSEGGLDLIQGMLDSTEGADVFKGTGTDAMNYALQTILTTESLKARRAYMMNQGQFKDKGNEANDQRGDFMASAYKNMMVAPVLAMKSEEELNAMGIPPEMRSVLTQYQALRQKIEEAMAARKSQSAPGAPAQQPAAPAQQQQPFVPGLGPKDTMYYRSDEIGALANDPTFDIDPTSSDPKMMAVIARKQYEKLHALMTGGGSKEEISRAAREFQEARARMGWSH